MPQNSTHNVKTAVVTGASSGIGLVVTRELARQGWRVILHGRNPYHSKAALADISRAVPGANITLVRADLSAMAEVRKTAHEIASLTNRTDLLVNNAGAIINKRQVTPEGFEATFAGNHLGPFLLTQSMMPLLRAAVMAAGEARIVNTASAAHQLVRDMEWGDLQLEQGYRPWKAYAQSKLANILFTRELAKRETGNGIKVSAAHPGVVDTNFPSGAGLLTQMGWLFAKPFTKTPEQGADTILWLATAGPRDPAGGYFEQRRPAQMTTAAQSNEGARRLWDISENLTRQA